jgi:hypothetical protein
MLRRARRASFAELRALVADVLRPGDAVIRPGCRVEIQATARLV